MIATTLCAKKVKIDRQQPVSFSCAKRRVASAADDVVFLPRIIIVLECSIFENPSKTGVKHVKRLFSSPSINRNTAREELRDSAPS